MGESVLYWEHPFYKLTLVLIKLIKDYISGINILYIFVICNIVLI